MPWSYVRSVHRNAFNSLMPLFFLKRFATLIAEYNKLLLRRVALWTGIGR